MSLDFTEYKCGGANYQLQLQEQWVQADYREVNEMLCIYAGSVATDENLNVQVWTGSSWMTMMTLASGWNNISVSRYLNSPTFSIRFAGSNDIGDTAQSSWQIDCVLLHSWSGLSNDMKISIYNYGKIDATITSVYIDDILFSSELAQIRIGEHQTIAVLPQGGWISGKTYHLKLVTTRGSGFEGEFVAP